MRVPPTSRWTCPRCGRTVAPRGDSPPRYCAICGKALPAAAIGHAGTHKPGMPEACRDAKYSAFAGMASFLPFCGPIFGITAIAVGLSAITRIDASGGDKYARRTAITGVALGCVGTLITMMICLGTMG